MREDAPELFLRRDPVDGDRVIPGEVDLHPHLGVVQLEVVYCEELLHGRESVPEGVWRELVLEHPGHVSVEDLVDVVLPHVGQGVVGQHLEVAAKVHHPSGRVLDTLPGAAPPDLLQVGLELNDYLCPMISPPLVGLPVQDLHAGREVGPNPHLSLDR